MNNKLNTGDLIDMMGARFEMVARMGSNQSDTVLFRTRMAPGRLVPLHSHIDPECFYLIEGRIEVFLVDDAPKWRAVDTGQSASSQTARSMRFAMQPRRLRTSFWPRTAGSPLSSARRADP